MKIFFYFDFSDWIFSNIIFNFDTCSNCIT